MAYDLTPSVYVFITNRFILAYGVATIVGIVIGTLSKEAGVTSDVNMAMVFITVFFIGFFPEQGVNWIATTAQKFLKQQQPNGKI